MSAMNRLLASVLLSGVCGGVACAEVQQPVAGAQQTEPSVALKKALQDMQQSGSDDMYAAVKAVLDAGGDETQFAAYMKEAAAVGCAPAKLWLATYMLSKNPPRPDAIATAPQTVEARKLVQDAADAGYVPALLEMSRFAGGGVGAPADEKLGMRYLMQACKAGSSAARASYLVVSGRLKPENLEAPEIVSELKKQNYQLEMLIAGMYGHTPQGIEWLKKAASHGSGRAALLLAQSAEAFGLTDDEARQYIMQATNDHVPEALAILGSLQLAGSPEHGVEANPTAGVRKLQESVALGYMASAVTLATHYLTQPDVYSAERVCNLCRIAAEQGDARALVAYGYCLVTGRGCTADAARGLAMLEEQASAGNPFAHLALADVYFNGYGTEADIRKAVDCLGEASAYGIPHAYVVMAAMTAMGNANAQPDERRARLYLKMAEEKGEPNAQEVYDAILAAKKWHFMAPVEKN